MRIFGGKGRRALIYLDNAATTAVLPESADAACEILREGFGNPSSLYALGVQAENRVKSARKTIAKALGCEPGELYFTSCGTESDNIAVLGAARARKNWGDEIVATSYEHPAVGNTVAALADEGFKVTLVAPGPDGNVNVDEMLAALTPKTVLVTAMSVNNETGAVVDVERLAAGVKANNKRTAFHTDHVQGFLKLPLSLKTGNIDSLALTGHKLGAPKGVGALYIRKGHKIAPTNFGGGQERGVRSGTENVAFIKAFAVAVEKLAADKDAVARMAALNKALRAGLERMGGIEFNSPEDAAPHILNFSMPYYRSESVLHYLEMNDIMVSSGSACSKGAASHTLAAMGLSPDRIDSAIRIGFCAANTMTDVDALLAALEQARKDLRQYK